MLHLKDADLELQLMTHMIKSKAISKKLLEKYQLHNAVGEKFLKWVHEVLRFMVMNFKSNGIQNILQKALYELMPINEEKRLRLPQI